MDIYMRVTATSSWRFGNTHFPQPISEPNYTRLAVGPPVTHGIWTVETTRSRPTSGFDPNVSGHFSVAGFGKAGKMSPRSGCYGLSPADGFPGIKGKTEAPLHLAFDMLTPEVEGCIGHAITLFVFHHHPPAGSSPEYPSRSLSSFQRWTTPTKGLKVLDER
jgi:hypothetical protein